VLEAAAGADDHTLLMWEEAAGSLAEDCPPTLTQLRSQIEETRRSELRSHAQLVRAETQLAGRLRQLGLARRLWHRRHHAVLTAQLADCRRRREQAERRLALLEAKLRVIEATEQARMVWITQAREVLVRGVAAAQVLADHHTHRDTAVEAPRPAAGDGREWPQAVS
jgi:hypothetical protein